MDPYEFVQGLLKTIEATKPERKEQSVMKERVIAAIVVVVFLITICLLTMPKPS